MVERWVNIALFYLFFLVLELISFEIRDVSGEELREDLKKELRNTVSGKP